MPLLKRYLDGVGVAQSPPLEAATQLTKAQVHALFDTLLPHYARYAQLSLTDLDGRALLSVGHAGLPPAGHDTDNVLLQKAKLLAPRDVYLYSPKRHLPDESGPSVGRPVMDIATPVYDTQGHRKGILRFTLDWQTLATHIQQTMALDATSYPLLVNARGTWLLDETQNPLPFGGDFASHSPETWKALLPRHHGKTDLDGQLVMFQSYDARIHHYQSQAGIVTSEPGLQPLRLGIVMTEPSLATLLSEDETPLLITLLLYLLSIAFGVYWATSHHRQLALRRQA